MHTFLESVSRVIRNPLVFSAIDNRNNNKVQNNAKNTTKAYVAASAPSCAICSENHKNYECSVLRGMSTADRNSKIKRKRLCIKCLKAFHGRNCKALSCKQCKGYHNTLLHIPNSIESQVSKDGAKSTLENKSSSAADNHTQNKLAAVSSLSSLVTLSNCSTQMLPQVLFSTAVILVRDNRSEFHNCRALLDSGPQSNFITKNCSKMLGIKPQAINTTVVGISSSSISVVQQISTEIKSRTSTFRVKLPFLIINKITKLLPTV